MDSDSLYSLDHVACSGHVFSVEHRTALETSLVLVKKNYKFEKVFFWGKILGLNRHYFIAQGRGEDEMKDRKYLYSFNCMDWFLLPTVTDSMIEQVAIAAKGRFMGEPSFIYHHQTHSGEEEDAEEEDGTQVNEETRLAVTVYHIDQEVSVVPRGAYIRSPNGSVHTNRSFAGLSESEAKKLHNFMHFRDWNISEDKPTQEMAEWTPAIDFLDVLSDDIPKGSWSLQFESAGKVCVLRSLLWLGLTFYHVPMTTQHGYVYVGDGLKNIYLQFML